MVARCCSFCQSIVTAGYRAGHPALAGVSPVPMDRASGTVRIQRLHGVEVSCAFPVEGPSVQTRLLLHGAPIDVDYHHVVVNHATHRDAIRYIFHQWPLLPISVDPAERAENAAFLSGFSPYALHDEFLAKIAIWESHSRRKRAALARCRSLHAFLLQQHVAAGEAPWPDRGLPSFFVHRGTGLSIRCDCWDKPSLGVWRPTITTVLYLDNRPLGNRQNGCILDHATMQHAHDYMFGNMITRAVATFAHHGRPFPEAHDGSHI